MKWKEFKSLALTEKIIEREAKKNDNKYQKFTKTNRFQTVDPSKRRKPLQTVRACSRHDRTTMQSTI